jgi:aldehyde:ferredoxin oxidoreductase
LIKGVASSPKYITIIDGEKQILDASDVWGLDAVVTEEKLVEKHGRVKTASIGQAGENISLISGIVNDKGRIAARSGLGAVMGSKKLKALVLKGNTKIELADNSLLVAKTKEYNEGINAAAAKPGAVSLWKDQGTPWMNFPSAASGGSPIKNWGGSVAEDFPIDKVKKLSADAINKYKLKDYGCFSCSVQCGAIMKVPEAGLEETHVPEYETCAAFQYMLLNDDLISLFKLNDLANRAGIDTISAGGTIAFAIECYENGLITKDDTGGLELTWGNSEAIIELLKKIINREGIGDILADGCKKAAEKLGKGSEYAIHSLGQELSFQSPKAYKSLGRTYAYDPTPGSHMAASLDLMLAGPNAGSLSKPNGLIEGFALPRRYRKAGDERNEALKLNTCLHQVINSLGMCWYFCKFQKYPLIEAIQSVVGWDITIEELLKTGQRIQSLRQAFTLREGIDIAKNEIPERAVGIDYKEEYKGYCEKMGWNPDNGYPLKDTLSDLGLDFVIKDLY